MRADVATVDVGDTSQRLAAVDGALDDVADAGKAASVSCRPGDALAVSVTLA